MAEAGNNLTGNNADKTKTVQSGKSFTTLEPKKEVQNFTWQIKDFLAVWEMATQTMEFNKIMFKFEIGKSIELSSGISLRLFIPDFHELDSEDTEYLRVRNEHVAVYIIPPRSPRRRTFISFNIWILRSDGTRFKEIDQKTPIDIADYFFEGFYRRIIDISELKDPANQILDVKDGSLSLEFEMTLYANQSREYLKRTYDQIEVQKQSSECLSKAFESMIKKKRYTDAVLVTSDGRTLKVHKSVLSARSSVFETMFETSMAENTTGVVNIADISFEALEIVLNYIYTGKLDNTWIEYMEEVVNAAEKYDLPLIKEIGDADLIQNVNKENAMELLKFAQLHQLKTAIVDLTEYIRINIVTILTPPENNEAVKK